MVKVYMVGPGFSSYTEKFSCLPQVGHILTIGKQDYVIEKIVWQRDRSVLHPVAFVNHRQ